MESSIHDQTSTRDFLYYVAVQMNKEPQDVEEFVAILESAWIEDVSGLKGVSDEQWKTLNIPMGFANQIKKHFPGSGSVAAVNVPVQK